MQKQLQKLIYFATLLLALQKSSTAQTIYTFAGNGTFGFSGDGGAATAAQLFHPSGVAVDASGNVYIVDTDNSRIRKVSTSGVISTFAGTTTPGFSGDGGLATAAQLFWPSGIAIDASDNVYIADINNQRIRKVNTSGIISTFAGIGTGGFSGDGSAAISAELNFPSGIAVDVFGNIYISDQGNHRIRKVNTAGVISTFAGTGVAGFSGNGAAATGANLNSPAAVAVDAPGNVYIADFLNNQIRKVNGAGVISTFAGAVTAGFSGDGGAATAAQLNNPSAVTVDASGNVYIADQYNYRIRKVNSVGIISTFVGTGVLGFSGDGGDPGLAKISEVRGIAVDASDNVYLADFGGQRIREICLSSCFVNINSTTEEQDGILIYPNPATGKLFISSTSGEVKNSEIEIVNTLGQVVIKTFISDEINISALAQGSYFLKIKFPDSQCSYSKFVKE